jgi:hypothetical protein
MTPSGRNDGGPYGPPMRAVSTGDVFLQPNDGRPNASRLTRTISNGSQQSQGQRRSPLPRVPSQGNLRTTPPSQFPSQNEPAYRGNFANPLSYRGGTPYRNAATPPFVAQVYEDGDTFEYSRPPMERAPYTSPINRGGPRMDPRGRTPSFRDGPPARSQSVSGARYPMASGGDRRGDGRGPPVLQRSPRGRMYPSNIPPPPGLTAPPVSAQQVLQGRPGGTGMRGASMRSPPNTLR